MWTCGKGVYAEPVAELALTLGLAGLRGLATYSRAQSWEPPQGRNLLGARVTILGGGGITTSLVRLLQPFDCHITVVRRRAEDLAGRRRRARGRPLRRRPAGSRPRRRRPRAHAGDGRADRRRRAGPDGGPRLARQRRPRQARRHRRPRRRPRATASSAAPDSTSPIPSRCRRAIRCGRCPTASSRRTSATPRRWRSRCSSERITTNVRRYADDEELIGLVDIEAGY